jgi:hypothetical protein
VLYVQNNFCLLSLSLAPFPNILWIMCSGEY